MASFQLKEMQLLLNSLMPRIPRQNALEEGDREGEGEEEGEEGSLSAQRIFAWEQQHSESRCTENQRAGVLSGHLFPHLRATGFSLQGSFSSHFLNEHSSQPRLGSQGL